ncbi:MAG: nucleotidyltransferase family protein [Thermodesulfobacteriota bacterium]
MTAEFILSIIAKNKDKIRIFGVKKLGLFGSFVREEQNAESDIDLLVEFERDKKTFDNFFIHLSFFLEELLKCHIELVTIESLSPYIRPYIIKEVKYVAFRT